MERTRRPSLGAHTIANFGSTFRISDDDPVVLLGYFGADQLAPDVGLNVFDWALQRIAPTSGSLIVAYSDGFGAALV